MQHLSLIFALFTGFAVSGATQAALHDRGGGLIYDDVLNITWLQDVNYAATSGYSTGFSRPTDICGEGGCMYEWVPAGLMPWGEAMDWAENLVYYDSVRNVTYDDWRLPDVSPIGGSAAFNYYYSEAGDTDVGYNLSALGTAYVGATGSELAYMYYNNFGNKGYYNIFGLYQGGYGLVDDPNNPNDESLFSNLLSDEFQAGAFWSGVEYAPDSFKAWTFHTSHGLQAGEWQGDQFSDELYYAWAVRPGDVAAVPEPEAYLLMLAGLGLVGWVGRRRR